MCVWRGEVFVAEQLTFFERIHRSSHFCLLDARLEFFFLKKRRQRKREKKVFSIFKMSFFLNSCQKRRRREKYPTTNIERIIKSALYLFSKEPFFANNLR